MNSVERVQSVLDGRRPDRPPVSFWHHFRADQVHGPKAVDAHVQHLEAYDLDFLKVMNDNEYPASGRVGCVEDLTSLTVLRGDEPEFARQLDLVADLRRRLGDRVLMTTTVFNVWATLRHLVRPPTQHKPPNMDASADVPSTTIRRFFEDDAHAVEQAIGSITTSLANFARRCIQAGADGIFLSVRDDWLDVPGRQGGVYDDLVRQADRDILAGAAEGRFNALHICGRAVDFRAFAGYPVHLINWADRAAGPSIAEVVGWVRPAVCGGVDNLSTLPNGTPDDCRREVADALKQAGDRPIIVGPGCTYDPDAVPPENLEAVCAAVRG